jgi:hypothetical protein
MVLVCYISPRALVSIYAWYGGVVGKLHNWEGPALIPEGDMSKAEYYIYGIQYSKEGWRTAISDHTGLPWYKTPGIIERF